MDFSHRLPPKSGISHSPVGERLSESRCRRQFSNNSRCKFDPADKSDTLTHRKARLFGGNVVKFRLNWFVTFLIAAVVVVVASTGFAQSSDQSLPTPVLTSEVNGTIAPLDLGDARVTRHFYAFDASPGDLIITIDSKNLNGDIDVFTAVTLRPLMKTTTYASTQMPEVTKSIFLRVHQILILRVEARTPNDEAGSYHIRFRGTFEPFSGGIPVAEATESTAESPRSSRGTKRVSSVGATIAEPPAETAAKAEPTPAPVSEPRAVATGPETENSKTATEAAKKAEVAKSTTAKTTARSTPRNTRRRAPARSKPTAQPKEPAEPSTSKSGTEPATESDAVKKETPGEGKTRAGTSETTANPEKPSQEITPPPTGVRLVIEQKDGTKIERPMSTVRRVVVEGNVIVIVLKTGRIERVPMSVVTRMAIEP
jgi:hypothetical protein